MGLFDDVISAHTANQTVATPSTSGSTSSSGGTSGQGDDSIIIIDDTISAPAPSVRDSISFFDNNTVAVEETAAPVVITEPVVPEGIISFSDEPAIISAIDPEVTFITEEPKTETITDVQDLNQLLVQVNSKEEDKVPMVEDTMFVLEPAVETATVQEKTVDLFSTPTDTPMMDMFSTSVVENITTFAPVQSEVKIESKPLENPLDILDDSISKLEALNANHDLVRQEREQEIEKRNQAITEFNKQIATLKKENVAINKEIDKIDQEKSRVIDMIKLFQSQKAA